MGEAAPRAWRLLNSPARSRGAFHLVCARPACRFGFTQEFVRLGGLDRKVVRPVTTEAFLSRFRLPVRRLADRTLNDPRADAERMGPRDWREAVGDFVLPVAAELGTGRTAAWDVRG